MTYIISPISVAQTATIINAAIIFVQFTISLSLVVLLVHFMPKENSALSWSSISRTLHSSVWPTILQTDSSSNRRSGAAVYTISHLGTLTTVLVAIAGVVLPLGLADGPVVASNFRQVRAQYVPDTSALALSTTPNRGSFVYGRQCGSFEALACPGNDNPNTTAIAPSVLEVFNSTLHGPFAMQYRRFYEGDAKQNSSVGFVGSAQTFILRDDIFAAEGIVVDMSPDHPGIGFWNQTLPDTPHGGTWSQDILWLEPVTQCVDTNLTVDYFMPDSGPEGSIKIFNITDHGGFVNLTRVPPSLNRDGQHIDLFQHAYKGAVYSNLFAMEALNATRDSSFIGAPHPLNMSSLSFSISGIDIGQMSVLPISYLNSTAASTGDIICQGYGGQDTANVTNVHVACGIFLGPPLRTDGGDPRVFNRGSKWRQGIHACSSATRASIQTVAFSTNGTTRIQDLRVSRAKSQTNVLWATEKTNMTISDIDLMWGRVDDRFENDPSLWTIRADSFYLPAGGASMWNVFPAGFPAGGHAHLWGMIYESGMPSDDGESVTDYSGRSDYSVKSRLQSLVTQDPTAGNIRIRNLIWTDMAANNFIGTQANDTLWVADHLKTIEYDFKYAIPGFILLLIWAPSFLGAVFLLITRSLTFERMRHVFNHTSVGRVVVGMSALRVQGRGGGPHVATPTLMPMPSFPYASSANPSFVNMDADRGILSHRRNKSNWANTSGSVRVALELGHPRRGSYDEDIKLLESPNRV